MQHPGPPVLYFHSVAPRRADEWMLRFLTMEVDRFEEQLRYLQARGYRSVFLDEWLAVRRGERSPHEKEICLTFDDGLLDNWVYAFPLARKYGMRITLFVCPELIDPRDVVRPTLEDVWEGRCREADLVELGNLSWRELRLMQASGMADVQSHTMSHTKYVVSDRLTGFYYGGFNGFYPLLNAGAPERKPFYMDDPGFRHRLPPGTPLFEETSAVVARKCTISPDFLREVAALAGQYHLAAPEQRRAFEARARRLYGQYRDDDRLVAGREPAEAFRRRQEYEIVESKRIIEERLEKPVRFLCWPHGNNSPEVHALAREAGYEATTAGNRPVGARHADRIPRIGTDWRIGRWWMRRKLDYKLFSHLRKQPWYTLWLANEYKNVILKR